jgi:hypothetical protein
MVLKRSSAQAMYPTRKRKKKKNGFFPPGDGKTSVAVRMIKPNKNAHGLLNVDQNLASPLFPDSLFIAKRSGNPNSEKTNK